MSSKNNSFFI